MEIPLASPLRSTAGSRPYSASGPVPMIDVPNSTEMHPGSGQCSFCVLNTDNGVFSLTRCLRGHMQWVADAGDHRAQAVLCHGAHVAAADADDTRVDIEESTQEPRARGLAAA